MKKGISVETFYDCSGQYGLRIHKEKGTLSLDEIRQTAMEYECDYYFLVMNCMDEENGQYYMDDLIGRRDEGDTVEMYPAQTVLKEWKRVKET